MSVGILAFDLSEERLEHECAVRGQRLYKTIHQARELISHRRRHCSTEKELRQLIEHIDQILWEAGVI